MKTSRFIIATMAVASFVFASCQKETDPVKEDNAKSVKFIAQSIETRTAFGEKDGSSYPTLWTNNDSNVKVSLNFKTPKDAAVTPSADYKSATFESTIEDDGTDSYTFYSLSPASAYLSVSDEHESYGFTVPTSQNPTASSVDEAAQILVAKSSTFNSWPSKVVFNYSHMTAYGRMSLSNLNLGGATITSIALTAAENWAGRWYYYFSDGHVSANSASATITLNTTSDEDIWFACAPVDLGGKKITVTVNTTAGPFEKEITWPTGKAFTSGKVYKFAVDMTGVTPAGTKTYTKVTSKADITVGSQLIIVADAANYAMSTTQNGNNRGQAAITKTDSTIDNPGADVQVFEAQAGNKANTIALYTGSGYIYAASSEKNYLKTQASLDDNASFSLEIANGRATLVAQGSNTKNTIQYNSSSSIFSCYSTSQGAVSIYKLNGSGTSESIFASIPVTGVTLDGTASVTVGGSKTLTYSVLPSNADNKNVSWSSSDTEVATVDGSGKVTGVAAGTATITVTTEDGSKTASCVVTVINQTAQKTILDLTTKTISCNAYNTTTTYGDWMIVNGANNSKVWAYFKMGGKNTTISSYNPCYIYNTTAISHKVEQITVSIAAGSLSKSGMSVNSWGVYVYSDKEMTNQIDYVSGGTITNSAGLFTFTPSNNVSWNAGYYYKISWNLANTTTTNGIVCVDKITLSSVAE